MKKHQTEVIAKLRSAKVRGLIVFHNPGSGKSITALTACRCLDLPAYLIVPGAVVSGFGREIERIPEFKKLQIKVITYGRFINAFRADPGMVRGHLLILDEAQNFRNPGTETLYLIMAFARATKTLLLTGTPIQNEPEDIIPALCMTHPEPPVMRSIDAVKKFYKNVQTEFGAALTNFEMHRRSADLTKIFHNRISYFRSRIESDPHYPRVRTRNVYVPMGKKYAQEYEIVESEQRSKLPSNMRDTNITVFYNGLRRATNMALEISPKIRAILSVVRRGLREKKRILIYSNWQESGIGIIKKKLEERRVRVVVVSGDESVAEKGRSVEAYNSGVAPVMLITKAGAAGLDLKRTRIVIIMEPHWNNELIKQVIARAARYDSHAGLPESRRRVTVYRFILQKPGGRKSQSGRKSDNKFGHSKSIDDMMTEISTNKERRIDNFYALLKKIAKTDLKSK